MVLVFLLFGIFSLSQDIDEPLGLSLSCGDEVQFFWNFHACIPVDDYTVLKMKGLDWDETGDREEYYFQYGVFFYSTIEECNIDHNYTRSASSVLLNNYMPPFAGCQEYWSQGWNYYHPIASFQEFRESYVFMQDTTSVTIIFDTSSCGTEENLLFVRVDNTQNTVPTSSCLDYFGLSERTSVGDFPLSIEILVVYKYLSLQCDDDDPSPGNYDTATIYHDQQCQPLYPAVIPSATRPDEYAPLNFMIVVDDFDTKYGYKISDMIERCSNSDQTQLPFYEREFGKCYNLQTLGYPTWLKDSFYKVVRITEKDLYRQFEESHIMARLDNDKFYQPMEDGQILDGMCPWQLWERIDDGDEEYPMLDKYTWEFFVKPDSCVLISSAVESWTGEETKGYDFQFKMKCDEGTGKVYITSVLGSEPYACNNKDYTELYSTSQCLQLHGEMDMFIAGFCPIKLENYLPGEPNNGIMGFHFLPDFYFWDGIEGEKGDYYRYNPYWYYQNEFTASCGKPDLMVWQRDNYCIPDGGYSGYFKNIVYDNWGKSYIEVARFSTLEDCVFHVPEIPEVYDDDYEKGDDERADPTVNGRRQIDPYYYYYYPPVDPYLGDYFLVGGCIDMFWGMTYEYSVDINLDDFCRYTMGYLGDYDMVRTLYVLDETCSQRNLILSVEIVKDVPIFFEDWRAEVTDPDRRAVLNRLEELFSMRRSESDPPDNKDYYDYYYYNPWWNDKTCELITTDAGSYFESFQYGMPHFCDGIEPFPVNPTPSNIKDQIGVVLEHFDMERYIFCTDENFVFGEWKVMYDCTLEHIGYEFQKEPWDWNDDKPDKPFEYDKQDGYYYYDDDVKPPPKKGHEEWVKVIRKGDGKYYENRYMNQEKCEKGEQHMSSFQIASDLNVCNGESLNKGMLKLSEFFQKLQDDERVHHDAIVEISYSNEKCSEKHISGVVVYSEKVSEKFYHEKFGECVVTGRASSVKYFDSVFCDLCDHLAGYGTDGLAIGLGVGLGVGIPFLVFCCLCAGCTVAVVLCFWMFFRYLNMRKKDQDIPMGNIQMDPSAENYENLTENQPVESQNVDKPKKKQQPIEYKATETAIPRTSPQDNYQVPDNSSSPLYKSFSGLLPEGKKVELKFGLNEIDLGDRKIDYHDIESLGEEHVQNEMTLFRFVMVNGDKNVVLIGKSSCAEFKKFFLEKMNSMESSDWSSSEDGD